MLGDLHSPCTRSQSATFPTWGGKARNASKVQGSLTATYFWTNLWLSASLALWLSRSLLLLINSRGNGNTEGCAVSSSFVVWLGVAVCSVLCAVGQCIVPWASVLCSWHVLCADQYSVQLARYLCSLHVLSAVGRLSEHHERRHCEFRVSLTMMTCRYLQRRQIDA